MRRIILTIILLLVLVSTVSAQTLKVGVKHAPPFVIIEQGKQPYGFSIDLMEQIGHNTDYDFEYVVQNTLSEHIKAVSSNDVDLGIAATTITSERFNTVDFSQPFFDSSLGLLTMSTGRKGLLGIFLSRKGLLIILGLTLYLLFAAHLIWFVERNHGLPNDYLKGIGQGIWWTVVTMSTVGYGDTVPKKPLGKFIGGAVILSGIIIFGIVVASLSSILTVNSLASSIEGPNNLVGQKVAAISSTLGEKEAKKMGMDVMEVTSIEEAVSLLINGEVKAFVHDTPILQYYLKATNRKDLVIAPAKFYDQSYGIIFPKHSPYLLEINKAILTLKENGIYSDLTTEWFGTSTA